MYYTILTIINTPIGNNRFVFEHREQILGKAEIVVPKMIEGNLKDVCLGETIAFAEMENGSLKMVTGLKHLVRLEREKKSQKSSAINTKKFYSNNDTPHSDISNHNTTPIYIIDNHNHALYCRWKECTIGLVEQGLGLIHIDQHSDMNDPKKWIDTTREQTLDSIARYTNEICTIADFIKPAQKIGLIGECKQIRTEYALLHDHIDSSGNKPFILDIDLDFWAPEMSIKEFDATIYATRNLIASAKLVTIATSPYFIDQNKALILLEKLLG